MSRTRTFADLIDDVRKRADVEGALDRHPDVDIKRYVNQGGAELQDLIMEVRGRRYFRSSTTIAISPGVTTYPLPVDFQSLLSVRISNYPGETLTPWEPQDEPWLRDQTFSVTNRPGYYDLQPGNIEFLPVPREPNLSIIVQYVPRYKDLVADADTLEGFDGWEEYAVIVAALAIATKDDEQDLIRTLNNDKAVLAARIRRMAPQRDRFRAERVKDTRGAMRPFIPWQRRHIP